MCGVFVFWLMIYLDKAYFRNSRVLLLLLMIRAAYSDKHIVVDILTKAFDHNKSVNFVVKQDKNRIRRISELMSYSFEMCFAFGEVFLSPERHACALILFPDEQRTTLKTISWHIELIWKSIGVMNVWKVLKRSTLIKRQYPDEPICHLWFGGVDPSYQRRGVASKWLNELVREDISRNRPLFLETSTQQNLSLYQKLGFQIYQQLEIAGHMLYLMRREPKYIDLKGVQGE